VATGRPAASVEFGLDPGHVSRLLGALEKRRLIARKRSESDARQAIVSLTARGRERYQFLDQRSTDDIGALLAPLSQADGKRLLSAMAAIESLLGDGTPPRVPYILRPNRPGDIGWVVSRHAALYAEEYGWDETFEGMVAEVAAEFIKSFDAKRERCWIAGARGKSSARCSWSGAPSRTPPSCACSMSSPLRAGSASVRGWSRSAGCSPAPRRTSASCCGPTAFC
jgi:hypothetical protein